jgi:ribosome-associated protein
MMEVVRFVTEPRSASRQKARLLAYATLNKKAYDPVILDLHGISDLTDFFIIASGNTDIQVRAVLQELQRVCRDQGFKVRHLEGEASGSWVLLDLGDVVVHLFRQPEREFYDLEGLWHRAKRVELPRL